MHYFLIGFLLSFWFICLIIHYLLCGSSCVQILTFTTIQAWGFGMSYAAYKFGRECAGLLPFLDEKRMYMVV